MTNTEYVACGGNACPFCHSTNIEGGKFDGEGREVWAEVKCLECDACWHDIYLLSRYEQR